MLIILKAISRSLLLRQSQCGLVLCAKNKAYHRIPPNYYCSVGTLEMFRKFGEQDGIFSDMTYHSNVLFLQFLKMLPFIFPWVNSINVMMSHTAPVYLKSLKKCGMHTKCTLLFLSISCYGKITTRT